MKTIFTILIIFLTTFSFSQARLGYTFSEISKEFSKEVISHGYPERQFLLVELAIADVYYVFDNSFVCTEVLVSPANAYCLQYFLNKYNQDYFKMNENTWINISDGVNTYVDILQAADGSYFFKWHY